MKNLKSALVVLTLGSLIGCTAAAPEVIKPVDDVNKPPPPPKEKTPQELFDQGIADFDSNKLDDAKKSFSKLIDKQPTLVAAHYNLGVVAERQSNLVEAEQFYEAAYKLDPNHRKTLLNLGKIYRLQDKFEKAITLYETALKAPGAEFDVALLNNLTVAYRLAKKFDKAELTARRVLARTKDNADAYKNLALIYFDQGNYRLAEFISANAKKLDDKDPGVYNNLGMIYLKIDERRLALGQFQKSVQLNDKFAPGHVNIGAMALSYRDYENAERSFAKATALDPTSYDGFLAYAWALDGQKGRDPKKGVAAGQAFEKVLALKADQADAICGAGWAYAVEKTAFDKAVPFLEKCKGLTTTTAGDQQLIDAKLKGIAAMQKAGAQAPAPAEKPKEKPKANTGPSMLDKVTDEAAKEEGAAPAPAPAPAPAETPAAAPAPAPTK